MYGGVGETVNCVQEQLMFYSKIFGLDNFFPTYFNTVRSHQIMLLRHSLSIIQSLISLSPSLLMVGYSMFSQVTDDICLLYQL